MESQESHFFKIIVGSILRDKKLRIPHEFVRKFGDELSGVVSLNVPNGRVWKVKLKKEEGKIWLSDGWNEFVECHSIHAGCFLVFKYENCSKFHVVIFGKSGCETQYPCNDEEPETVDESRRHRNETYNSKGSLPQKRQQNIRIESDEHKLSALLQEMGIYLTGKYGSNLTTEDQERVLSFANSVKPKNPAFMVILRPHGVHRDRLYVPIKFGNKYLSKIASCRLQDSHGKKWPVKINWTNGMGFRLSKGWSQFSRDNNLNGRDVCLFELIRKRDIVLKLSVCKAPPNPSSSPVYTSD